MRAEDNNLVRLFGAADFTNGVEHLDWFVAERICDLKFDFDRTMLQQTKKHAVTFAGDEGRGNLTFIEFLAADAGHVQEGMRLVGIPQDSSDAFLLEEFVAGTAQSDHIRKRRGSRRLALGRRRRLHGTKNRGVLIFGLWRGKGLRLLINHDRAFELAVEVCE